MGAALVWLVLVAVSGVPGFAQGAPSAVSDEDHDGVDDGLEAALLAKFRPTLMISSADCDGRPAEFAAGGAEPSAGAKNGAAYGQVFRRQSAASGAEWLEIHYYHLWSRDCGSRGHPLDVEHVSALVEAPALTAASSEWRARLWYAAAHEDTVCDASRWTRGARLGAEQSGAVIWISAGKHASYLNAELCGGGCGRDRCEQMIRLEPGPLINLGEPGAPLNGATWTGSTRWQLARKMGTDFPDAVLAQPDAEIEARGGTLRRTQAVIAASATGADSVAAAGASADSALGRAGQHSDRAADVAARHAGGSVKKAVRATGRFLGLSKPKPADQPSDANPPAPSKP